MSTVTVYPGDVVVKDPSDERFLVFDFDTENLAAGAQITSPTITIAVVRGDNTTPLTVDNTSLLTGNRKVQTRIKAGTLGTAYNVACKIVTNETPTQTKEYSINVLVQNR